MKNVKDLTDLEIDEKFDLWCALRDEAQEYVSALNAERHRRNDEDVKRLRAASAT